MIIYLIKKFSRIMLISSLFSLITAAASLALFHMVSEAGYRGFTLFEIMVFGSLLLLLFAGSMIASSKLSYFSSGTVDEVRQTLLQRVLKTDYQTVAKIGKAKLHNILVNDVNAISGALAEMPAFIYNSFLLIACLSYLFALSPTMFGVLSVTVVLSYFVTQKVMAKISKEATTMRNHQDDMFEGYKGVLEGAKQLSLNESRKGSYFKQQLRPAMEKLKDSERRYGFAWDLNRNFSQVMVFLVLGSIVAANGHVQNPQLVMSYILIVTYLSGPFGYVLNLWQNIARAKVSLEKIDSLNIASVESLLNEAPKQHTKLDEIGATWKSLNCENIGFSYPSDGDEKGFSVSNLDVQINKGDTVFITGGNGSGKSTFIHLLLGLAKSDQGKIKIDEIAINDGNLAAYRDKFAIVLPDFYLYDQLINKEGESIPAMQSKELLSLFELEEKVEVVESNFTSVDYSQGQRKRLALISAILEDKEIYVLDEWAADQDPYFREVFYSKILPWLKGKGKTVVAVTHDDRYFDMADKHIKFESGKIVDYPGIQKVA